MAEYERQVDDWLRDFGGRPRVRGEHERKQVLNGWRNGWQPATIAQSISTGREKRRQGSARFVPDVVTKAKAADKKYGYFRPDDQFTIEAIHLSEVERKKLADRIFDKADDPYVSMSLGKLIVAPSRHSYFGDELFVAVKESIKRPYRFEASGNRFVIL